MQFPELFEEMSFVNMKSQNVTQFGHRSIESLLSNSHHDQQKQFFVDSNLQLYPFQPYFYFVQRCLLRQVIRDSVPNLDPKTPPAATTATASFQTPTARPLGFDLSKTYSTLGRKPDPPSPMHQSTLEPQVRARFRGECARHPW